MATQELPFDSSTLEAMLEHATDGPVEIKDRATGEVVISVLTAEKGHPNYESHLGTIIDHQFLSPEADARVQYPVGSDRLEAPIAGALRLPVMPIANGEIPLPIYENLRPLGPIPFTQEEISKAIGAVRAAKTVVLVRVGKDQNNQTQSILLLDNGNQAHHPVLVQPPSGR